MTEEGNNHSGTLFADRYDLKRLLGEGAMGSVYLAHDLVLDEHIALKILHPGLLSDQNHAERFLREIQLTRKVTHPNVVRTFDVGLHQGYLYLTMEFVEGISLKDKLLAGPIRTDNFINLATQICEGLSAIHEAEIVHRDLKPANIVETLNRGIKIADFGVAQGGVEEFPEEGGEILGSAAYLAPEGWKGGSVGISTDLYALGVTFYEMLTGVLPFEAKTSAELMCRHLDAVPVRIRKRERSVPSWLEELVFHLLEKDPVKRYPSAAEVALALREGKDEGRVRKHTGEFKALGAGFLGGSDPAAEAEKVPKGKRLLYDAAKAGAKTVRQKKRFSLPGEEWLAVRFQKFLKALRIKLPEKEEPPFSFSARFFLGAFITIGIFFLLCFPVGSLVKSFFVGVKASPHFLSVPLAIGATLFLYGLLVSTPLLFLGFIISTIKNSFFSWGKASFAVAIVVFILSFGGLLRVENFYAEKFEYQVLSSDQTLDRFFSILPLSITNIVEASGFLPLGTLYEPALEYLVPVLRVAKGGVVPELFYLGTLLFFGLICIYTVVEDLFRLRKGFFKLLPFTFILFFVFPVGLHAVSAMFLEAEKISIWKQQIGAFSFSLNANWFPGALLSWGVFVIVAVILKRLLQYSPPEDE